MLRFIEEHRDRFGVEPICQQLQIALSTYYELKARERDPARAPARQRRDLKLEPLIQRVWHENPSSKVKGSGKPGVLQTGKHD